MQATCSQCASRIQVDDSKVPDRPFKVKCPKCQALITLPGKSTAAPAESEAASGAEAPAAPPPPPAYFDERQRGIASGMKGFMDMTGAMLGFVLLSQLLGANKTSLALGVIAAILMGTWLLAALLTPEDVPGSSPGSQVKTISLPRLFRLDLTQQAVFKQLLPARFLFLFGVYAIGRFLLFFVAERLGLDPDQAAEQAGLLLGGLALITILASPITVWLTDRFGRVPLMVMERSSAREVHCC